MKLTNRILDVYRYVKNQKYLESNISDYLNLSSEIFNNLECVFVLSTGRAGTELLENIFRLDKRNLTFHEPQPDLVYASRMAYEIGPDNKTGRKLAFVASRYHLLKKSYLIRKRYIETNNKISFFADAIHDLLPNSMFIHLVRDPRNFVRSAMRRKYYQGHDYDDGRLIPAKGSTELNWDSASLIMKNGWLWNETNQYIENIKNTMNSERIKTIRSEDLFNNPKNVKEILEFLKINVSPDSTLDRILKRPVNIQVKGSFPDFKNWSESDKDDLMGVTPLGKKYGFWK